MIIWSGKGFLPIIVLLLSFVFFTAILPDGIRPFTIALSFLTAGTFSWVMGKKWHQKTQVVIDKATGEEIELRSNHSLFWIKMEYWGFLFLVVGVLVLITNIVAAVR